MTAREMITEIKGEQCVCGGDKRANQSFCRKCYFALDADTRRALYSRIGQGYEEAYDAAIEELVAAERIRA